MLKIIMMGLGIRCVLLSVYGLLYGVAITLARAEKLSDLRQDAQVLVRVLPKKIELDVWKVENDGKTPVHPEESSYTFKSDSCYIVQAKRNGRPFSCTYYWIGKSSTEGRIRDITPYYAMELESQRRQSTRICREEEGQESPGFKELFTQKRTDEIPRAPISDPNAVRMFLIGKKANDELDLQGVQLSYSYTQSGDHCLIFAGIEKVYVYCRGSTTGNQEIGAFALAKIMQKRKGLNREDIIMIFSPGNTEFRKFSAELKLHIRNPGSRSEQEIVLRPNEFTPAELRRILAQVATIEILGTQEFVEFYRTTILKIFSEKLFTVEKVFVSYNHVPINLLETDKCYLIDSHSTAGLFLWFGAKSSIKLRQDSCRVAETYLKRREYGYVSPITYIYQEDVPQTIRTVQDMIRKLNPTTDKDQSASIRWVEGGNYDDDRLETNMMPEWTSQILWNIPANLTLPTSFSPTWMLP